MAAWTRRARAAFRRKSTPHNKIRSENDEAQGPYGSSCGVRLHLHNFKHQKPNTMKLQLPKHHSLQALSSAMATVVVASGLFALTPSAHAAVLIDSITTTGDGTGGQYGSISSFTFGSTTYSNLIAPTSVSATSGGSDFIWIDGTTEPTTVPAAIGGLGLDAGLLNTTLSSQFGQVVTDADMFFILVNQGPPSFPAVAIIQIVVQAIDSGGNSVGGTTTIGDLSVPTDGTNKIVIDRDWKRTGGSTLTSRELYGVAFSLADLGLAGNTTVTGFSFVDGTGGQSGVMDPQTIGLAVAIPEPSSALLGGFGMLLLLRRRRRC